MFAGIELDDIGIALALDATMVKPFATLLVLLVVAGCSTTSPNGSSNGECSSLPGDTCTAPDSECFTHALGQGAWLRCCDGKWFEEQGSGVDAALFACPEAD